jgi:hypothetical protein
MDKHHEHPSQERRDHFRRVLIRKLLELQDEHETERAVMNGRLSHPVSGLRVN